MEVKIRLNQTSQPKIFQNVTNTYQKGDMFCIYIESQNKVHKYPIMYIFDIEESYESESQIKKL